MPNIATWFDLNRQANCVIFAPLNEYPTKCICRIGNICPINNANRVVGKEEMNSTVSHLPVALFRRAPFSFARIPPFPIPRRPFHHLVCSNLFTWPGRHREPQHHRRFSLYAHSHKPIGIGRYWLVLLPDGPVRFCLPACPIPNAKYVSHTGFFRALHGTLVAYTINWIQHRAMHAALICIKERQNAEGLEGGALRQSKKKKKRTAKKLSHKVECKFITANNPIHNTHKQTAKCSKQHHSTSSKATTKDNNSTIVPLIFVYLVFVVVFSFSLEQFFINKSLCHINHHHFVSFNCVHGVCVCVFVKVKQGKNNKFYSNNNKNNNRERAFDSMSSRILK